MDIQIIEHIKETLSVIIQCDKIDDEVIRLKSHIESFDNTLYALMDKEKVKVNLSEIFYFESVDNHTFLYTQKEVMEVKYRLYELEKLLFDKDFVRISKSIVVNIDKIHSLKPELNRTILVTLCNGELLSISRKYVPFVRKLLSV